MHRIIICCKIGLGYAAYLFGVILVCLYVLFPEQRVQRYLLDHFHGLFPGCQMRMGAVSLVFPPAVRMHRVILDYALGHQIRAPSFSFRPRWFSLLTAANEIRFEGQVGGGAVSGRALFFPGDLKYKARVAAFFSGLRIEEMAAIGASGRIDGNLTCQWHPQHPVMAQGTFEIQDMDLSLAAVLPGMGRLFLKRTWGTLKLGGADLLIEQLQVDGHQLDGSLTGSVTLASNLRESTLQLAGRFYLTPAFIQQQPLIKPLFESGPGWPGKRAVSLQIRGKLAQPDVMWR